MQSEISKVKGDVATILRDLRGSIDEALVQIDLGEMNIRDLLEPVINRVANAQATLRSHLG